MGIKYLQLDTVRTKDPDFPETHSEEHKLLVPIRDTLLIRETVHSINKEDGVEPFACTTSISPSTREGWWGVKQTFHEIKAMLTKAGVEIIEPSEPEGPRVARVSKSDNTPS